MLDKSIGQAHQIKSIDWKDVEEPCKGDTPA